MLTSTSWGLLWSQRSLITEKNRVVIKFNLIFTSRGVGVQFGRDFDNALGYNLTINIMEWIILIIHHKSKQYMIKLWFIILIKSGFLKRSHINKIIKPIKWKRIVHKNRELVLCSLLGPLRSTVIYYSNRILHIQQN